MRVYYVPISVCSTHVEPVMLVQFSRDSRNTFQIGNPTWVNSTARGDWECPTVFLGLLFGR